MEQQIIDLLIQMQKEQREFREEQKEAWKQQRQFNSAVMGRFDKLESLLNGVGSQFELTTEKQIEDIGAISKRLSAVESDIYRLTRN